MNFRRWIWILSASLVVLLLQSSKTMAGTCGDVNNDGSGPDISDLVYLVGYMFQSGPPPPQMYTSDVNGDGSTVPDIADLVYLVTYMFQGGPDLMCPSYVVDIDGNVYQTVTIGTQVWMMENLKVTHYRNGDPIPHVTDSVVWGVLYTGAYCDYNNDQGNVATYGRLYNWFAVADSRNIAPEGWHVPTDEEWKQLEMFLGMSQAQADGTSYRGTDEGGQLKEAGTTHWAYPNAGATNESGFTALPGGYRLSNGNFLGMGHLASFWSSTEGSSFGGWNRGLDYYFSQVDRSYVPKQGGFSVRCVRD